MEYSENFNFSLPSRDNDIDLADINEISNNFRKIDENATKKQDFENIKNEVKDARVGYDRTAYDTLGEAVRMQVGELNSYFTKSKNKIKTIIEGEIVASNGVISTNSSFKRTDYILLPAGTYVYSNDSNLFANFRYAVFGLDKTFERFLMGATNTVITLTETKYIIICDGKSRFNLQLEEGELATEYEPYSVIVDASEQIKTNGFKGKTILFDGDSITAGTGFTSEEMKTIIYPQLVAKELGMNVVNNAIGGSALASNPNNEKRNPLVLRYANDTTEADIVYIAIGTNDWAYQYTPIGTMEDRGTTTFYGALHTLCEGLLNKYPTATIVFATPIKRKVLANHTTPTEYLRNGKTLKEYGEIIKEVCDFYSIPVLDMYSECLITPFVDEQRELYFQETNGTGVHPNALGQEVMARRVVAYLRSIIGF